MLTNWFIYSFPFISQENPLLSSIRATQSHSPIQAEHLSVWWKYFAALWLTWKEQRVHIVRLLHLLWTGLQFIPTLTRYFVSGHCGAPETLRAITTTSTLTANAWFVWWRLEGIWMCGSQCPRLSIWHRHVGVNVPGHIKGWIIAGFMEDAFVHIPNKLLRITNHVNKAQ